VTRSAPRPLTGRRTRRDLDRLSVCLRRFGQAIHRRSTLRGCCSPRIPRVRRNGCPDSFSAARRSPRSAGRSRGCCAVRTSRISLCRLSSANAASAAFTSPPPSCNATRGCTRRRVIRSERNGLAISAIARRRCRSDAAPVRAFRGRRGSRDRHARVIEWRDGAVCASGVDHGRGLSNFRNSPTTDSDRDAVRRRTKPGAT